MTLHTVYPIEMILQGAEDPSFYPYVDIVVGGMHMQVEPINAQQAKIIRLYFAPTHHYLNPNLQPGQLIHFTPKL